MSFDGLKSSNKSASVFVTTRSVCIFQQRSLTKKIASCLFTVLSDYQKSFKFGKGNVFECCIETTGPAVPGHLVSSLSAGQ